MLNCSVHLVLSCIYFVRISFFDIASEPTKFIFPEYILLKLPTKTINYKNTHCVYFTIIFSTSVLGRGGESEAVFNYGTRHEDVWVSGGIALCILNLGTIWS